MKRIKHNDLTHYFMTPHEQLPASYLSSCEKFFKSIKQQASSTKQQAARPEGPSKIEKNKKTFDIPHSPWYKVIMSRSLKPEFQPGGAERQHILDKAVEYILDPKFGTQNAKHAFLLEEVGLSQTEYLEALNRATNGGLVKSALWNSN